MVAGWRFVMRSPWEDSLAERETTTTGSGRCRSAGCIRVVASCGRALDNTIGLSEMTGDVL
jgi:hypothetical protein